MLGQQGIDGPTEEVLDKVAMLNTSHLLDHLPDPLMLLDTGGRVVSLNCPAESILGRTSSECEGQLLGALLSNNFSDQGLDLYHQAFKQCINGTPARASLVFDTPHNVDRQCVLLPSWDAHGTLDGVLLLIGDGRGAEPPRGETDPYEVIKVLASTSLEVIEGCDLKEMIESEASRLARSLGLDFAIFRILHPQEQPQIICHGIEVSDARLVLESRLSDGSMLYQTVNRGQEMIIDDLERSEVNCPVPEIRSMVCLTVNWSERAYGCAVFGNHRLGGDLDLLYPILQVFCNHVATSLRNARLHQELMVRSDILQGLYETTQALSSTLELKELLHTILQTARKLVSADNCYIFQLNRSRERLEAIAHITEEEIREVPELKVGEGITGLVAHTGKGQLVVRADLDPRAITVPGTPKDDPSSIICVPLRFSDDLLGVMTLEKRPGIPFTKKQYELIELFSLQAAMAIHRASQYDKTRAFASNLQMYNVLLTHDVANFNVPIHGFLEMLIKDPKLDMRQRRYVRSALVQSDNISEVISDIRELSRLRSQMGEAPLETVNLVPILKEAREDLLSNAVNEDVEAHISSAPDMAMVMADASLKVLFHNLLAYAFKYGQGRPVEIDVMEHVDASGVWWRVRIMDAGKGIPDEQKKGMFKRFDRLDTVQGSDGYGLSMSVVGILTDRYHGKVWVEDRVPGDPCKGASYNVIFPKIDTRVTE